MSSFALIFNGKVADVASAEFPVHPDLTWVDISAVSPAPQHGWSYSGGAFAAPAAPVLTLAQQAGMALASGLAVTSTGTPALNGTYDTSPASQGRMAAVSTYILVNAKFPGGVTSYGWVDTSGAAHVFPTTASFQAFATAVADYVSVLDQIIVTGSGTIPPAGKTIP